MEQKSLKDIIASLDPAQLAAAEAVAEEHLFGFTASRAAQFIRDSWAEAHPTDGSPGDGETDIPGDAAGKFEHFLRVDRHWGGAVDAAWPFLKGFAEQVVAGALARMKAEGTAPDGI